MKILLCNDDGYGSSGLLAIRDVLAAQGHQVCVVAPEEERSATGHAITWRAPLSVREVESGIFAVSGTPADCARLGLLEIFPDADFAVSGVNIGYNAGKDTLYSGTVAAAMEAAILGCPAMAVSTEWSLAPDYSAACACAVQMLDHLLAHPLDRGQMCNVNAPSMPAQQLRGIRLGTLHDGSTVQGFERYCSKVAGEWYFTQMKEKDVAPKGTDMGLLNEGFASVTYLSWRLSVDPPDRPLPL